MQLKHSREFQVWSKYHYGNTRLFLPHSLFASFLKANQLNVNGHKITFSPAQEDEKQDIFIKLIQYKNRLGTVSSVSLTPGLL